MIAMAILLVTTVVAAVPITTFVTLPGHDVYFKGSDKNITMVFYGILKWQRYRCNTTSYATNADSIIRIYNDGSILWKKTYENHGTYNATTYSLTLKNVTTADNGCYRLVNTGEKDTDVANYMLRVIGK